MHLRSFDRDAPGRAPDSIYVIYVRTRKASFMVRETHTKVVFARRKQAMQPILQHNASLVY